MVTLGVALIVQEVANRLDWLTGGADGLQGVLPGPVAGVFAFDMFGRTAYLYSLSVLFVLFMLARRMMVSPFGLSLRAIKGNTLRASAVGVPVRNRLIAAYTTGATYAAVAGALAGADHAVRVARRARLPPLRRCLCSSSSSVGSVPFMARSSARPRSS